MILLIFIVFYEYFSVLIVMPSAHIAYRVDHEVLLNNPESVLQRMSFKILEKREEILKKMINTKIKFKTSKGIEQGICQNVQSNTFNVKVGSAIIRVPLSKVLFSEHVS